MRYNVLVGNIGCVYSGSDERIARDTYKIYVEQSKSNVGRAGGESVTLMERGEIKMEFTGKLDKETN
jgi:hypothetical protein